MKHIKTIMILVLIFGSSCYASTTENSTKLTDIISYAISPTCLLNNYYFVTRLKDAIALLHKIPKDIIQELPFEQLTRSDNITINQSITNIKNTKKLHAFFLCWHNVTNYQVIIDEKFFTEFATLTCKLLCLVTKTTIDKTKTSTLETIINISQKIDKLPLSEILHTIDMLTDELPAFLEKYEFNSTISWKAWLKKYWWIPPVTTFWFGLKILIKFQHKPNYLTYGYYQQPIPTPIITNDPALLEIMRKQETINH